MFDDLSSLFFLNGSTFDFNSTDEDFTSILVDSTSKHPYSFEVNIVLAVIGTFTSLVTIAGNVLVLVSFFVDRQIRQPTNYFLFSLAISDFLIGCISMPFLTLAIYKNQWVLGSFLCDIWLSLDYTVCLASIYTVLLITIDRFCSVKIPTQYRNWRTEKRIVLLVLLTWFVPALIFFASTMGYPLFSGKPNLSVTDLQCDVQWNKNPYFNLGLTVAYFWVTLLVMFILYIFIYRVARALEQRSQANAKKVLKTIGISLQKNHRKIPSQNHASSLAFRAKKNKQLGSIDEDVVNALIDNHQPTSPINRISNGLDGLNRSSSNENSAEHAPINPLTMDDSGKKLDENRSLLSTVLDPPLHSRTRSLLRSRSRSKARKALRTITVIMGAFVLCWTPWHIHTIIQTFCQTCRESLIFNTYLFHACYFLCYLNSPINPFCYALANRQFKKTYMRLLRFDFRKL